MWQQYCQVIWVAEYLKLPSCSVVICVSVNSTGYWQSVDNCRWVTGIFQRILSFFLLRHKAAEARQQSQSLLTWEWKLCKGKTDGYEMVKLFGTAVHNFLMRSFVVSLNADINCLLGSAASGRSSCNNTAVTELWRVYDLVPAVKLGESPKAMGVKFVYMIAMCI